MDPPSVTAAAPQEVVRARVAALRLTGKVPKGLAACVVAGILRSLKANAKGPGMVAPTKASTGAPTTTKAGGRPPAPFEIIPPDQHFSKEAVEARKVLASEEVVVDAALRWWGWVPRGERLKTWGQQPQPVGPSTGEPTQVQAADAYGLPWGTAGTAALTAGASGSPAPGPDPPLEFSVYKALGMMLQQVLLPALGCTSVDLAAAAGGFDFDSAWKADLHDQKSFDDRVLVGALFKVAELVCGREDPFAYGRLLHQMLEVAKSLEEDLWQVMLEKAGAVAPALPPPQRSTSPEEVSRKKQRVTATGTTASGGAVRRSEGRGVNFQAGTSSGASPYARAPGGASMKRLASSKGGGGDGQLSRSRTLDKTTYAFGRSQSVRSTAGGAAGSEDGGEEGGGAAPLRHSIAVPSASFKALSRAPGGSSDLRPGLTASTAGVGARSMAARAQAAAQLAAVYAPGAPAGRGSAVATSGASLRTSSSSSHPRRSGGGTEAVPPQQALQGKQVDDDGGPGFLSEGPAPQAGVLSGPPPSVAPPHRLSAPGGPHVASQRRTPTSSLSGSGAAGASSKAAKLGAAPQRGSNTGSILDSKHKAPSSTSGASTRAGPPSVPGSRSGGSSNASGAAAGRGRGTAAGRPSLNAAGAGSKAPGSKTAPPGQQ